MKLTIFGATGGVGSRLVAMALDAGHNVTAFVRKPASLPQHPALTVVQGELSDVAAIGKAIAGADAVLNALGPRQNSPDQSEIRGPHQRAEAEIVRASGLEWIVVRPPRIVPGEATGKYRVFPDRVPSPRISQGDVADLILKCASGSEWVRRAPIPGY